MSARRLCAKYGQCMDEWHAALATGRAATPPPPPLGEWLSLQPTAHDLLDPVWTMAYAERATAPWHAVLKHAMAQQKTTLSALVQQIDRIMLGLSYGIPLPPSTSAAGASPAFPYGGRIIVRLERSTAGRGAAPGGAPFTYAFDVHDAPHAQLVPAQAQSSSAEGPTLVLRPTTTYAWDVETIPDPAIEPAVWRPLPWVIVRDPQALGANRVARAALAAEGAGCDDPRAPGWPGPVSRTATAKSGRAVVWTTPPMSPHAPVYWYGCDNDPHMAAGQVLVVPSGTPDPTVAEAGQAAVVEPPRRVPLEAPPIRPVPKEVPVPVPVPVEVEVEIPKEEELPEVAAFLARDAAYGRQLDAGIAQTQRLAEATEIWLRQAIDASTSAAVDKVGAKAALNRLLNEGARDMDGLLQLLTDAAPRPPGTLGDMIRVDQRRAATERFMHTTHRNAGALWRALGVPGVSLADAETLSGPERAAADVAAAEADVAIDVPRMQEALLHDMAEATAMRALQDAVHEQGGGGTLDELQDETDMAMVPVVMDQLQEALTAPAPPGEGVVVAEEPPETPPLTEIPLGVLGLEERRARRPRPAPRRRPRPGLVAEPGSADTGDPRAERAWQRFVRDSTILFQRTRYAHEGLVPPELLHEFLTERVMLRASGRHTRPEHYTPVLREWEAALERTALATETLIDAETRLQGAWAVTALPVSEDTPLAEGTAVVMDPAPPAPAPVEQRVAVEAVEKEAPAPAPAPAAPPMAGGGRPRRRPRGEPTFEQDERARLARARAERAARRAAARRAPPPAAGSGDAVHNATADTPAMLDEAVRIQSRYVYARVPIPRFLQRMNALAAEAADEVRGSVAATPLDGDIMARRAERLWTRWAWYWLLQQSATLIPPRTIPAPATMQPIVIERYLHVAEGVQEVTQIPLAEADERRIRDGLARLRAVTLAVPEPPTMAEIAQLVKGAVGEARAVAQAQGDPVRDTELRDVEQMEGLDVVQAMLRQARRWRETRRTQAQQRWPSGLGPDQSHIGMPGGAILATLTTGAPGALGTVDAIIARRLRQWTITTRWASFMAAGAAILFLLGMLALLPLLLPYRWVPLIIQMSSVAKTLMPMAVLSSMQALVQQIQPTPPEVPGEEPAEGATATVPATVPDSPLRRLFSQQPVLITPRAVEEIVARSADHLRGAAQGMQQERAKLQAALDGVRAARERSLALTGAGGDEAITRDRLGATESSVTDHLHAVAKESNAYWLQLEKGAVDVLSASAASHLANIPGLRAKLQGVITGVVPSARLPADPAATPITLDEHVLQPTLERQSAMREAAMASVRAIDVAGAQGPGAVADRETEAMQAAAVVQQTVETTARATAVVALAEQLDAVVGAATHVTAAGPTTLERMATVLRDAAPEALEALAQERILPPDIQSGALVSLAYFRARQAQYAMPTHDANATVDRDITMEDINRMLGVFAQTQQILDKPELVPVVAAMVNAVIIVDPGGLETWNQIQGLDSAQQTMTLLTGILESTGFMKSLEDALEYRAAATAALPMTEFLRNAGRITGLFSDLLQSILGPSEKQYFTQLLASRSPEDRHQLSQALGRLVVVMGAEMDLMTSSERLGESTTEFILQVYSEKITPELIAKTGLGDVMSDEDIDALRTGILDALREHTRGERRNQAQQAREVYAAIGVMRRGRALASSLYRLLWGLNMAPHFLQATVGGANTVLWTALGGLLAQLDRALQAPTLTDPHVRGGPVRGAVAVLAQSLLGAATFAGVAQMTSGLGGALGMTLMGVGGISHLAAALTSRRPRGAGANALAQGIREPWRLLGGFMRTYMVGLPRNVQHFVGLSMPGAFTWTRFSAMARTLHLAVGMVWPMQILMQGAWAAGLFVAPASSAAMAAHGAAAASTLLEFAEGVGPSLFNLGIVVNANVDALTLMTDAVASRGSLAAGLPRASHAVAQQVLTRVGNGARGGVGVGAAILDRVTWRPIEPWARPRPDQHWYQRLFGAVDLATRVMGGAETMAIARTQYRQAGRAAARGAAVLTGTTAGEDTEATLDAWEREEDRQRAQAVLDAQHLQGNITLAREQAVREDYDPDWAEDVVRAAADVTAARRVTFDADWGRWVANGIKGLDAAVATLERGAVVAQTNATMRMAEVGVSRPGDIDAARLLLSRIQAIPKAVEKLTALAGTQLSAAAARDETLKTALQTLAENSRAALPNIMQVHTEVTGVAGNVNVYAAPGAQVHLGINVKSSIQMQQFQGTELASHFYQIGVRTEQGRQSFAALSKVAATANRNDPAALARATNELLALGESNVRRAQEALAPAPEPEPEPELELEPEMALDESSANAHGIGHGPGPGAGDTLAVVGLE